MWSEDDEAQPRPVPKKNTVAGVVEVKIPEPDQNFYYCCTTNCWQRIPCAEHQAAMFANPQLSFQSIIQASGDITTTVSTLHRWAVWAVQQADENKYL